MKLYSHLFTYLADRKNKQIESRFTTGEWLTTLSDDDVASINLLAARLVADESAQEGYSAAQQFVHVCHLALSAERRYDEVTLDELVALQVIVALERLKREGLITVEGVMHLHGNCKAHITVTERGIEHGLSHRLGLSARNRSASFTLTIP